MLKLLLPFLFVLLLLLSCVGRLGQPTGGFAPSHDCVEIVLFHLRPADHATLELEKYTLSVIDRLYASEVSRSRIIYSPYSLADTQSEVLADHYKLKTSAILVICWVGGKPDIHNLTEYAYQVIENNPNMYCYQLKTLLNQLLKQLPSLHQTDSMHLPSFPLPNQSNPYLNNLRKKTV